MNCFICTENFRRTRTQNCNHCFHRVCLRRWTRQSTQLNDRSGQIINANRLCGAAIGRMVTYVQYVEDIPIPTINEIHQSTYMPTINCRTCDVCGRDDFRSTSAKSLHKSSHTIHLCECGLKFTRPDNLRRHKLRFCPNQ